MSMNRVCIMGRLTRDPELRRTQSGTAVTHFSLAVDEDRKDKDTGERKAHFFDFVAWGTTAEFVVKYFTKGRMAVVDGRLQTRGWVDNDGNNRKTIEIVAENVYFGDSRSREGENTAQRYDASQRATGGFTEVEDDGDLPF